MDMVDRRCCSSLVLTALSCSVWSSCLRRLVLVTGKVRCESKLKKSSSSAARAFCAKLSFQNSNTRAGLREIGRPHDNTTTFVSTHTLFDTPQKLSIMSAAQLLNPKAESRASPLLLCICSRTNKHTEARGSSTRQHLRWRGPAAGMQRSQWRCNLC
jgi:hypothetical protein